MHQSDRQVVHIKAVETKRLWHRQWALRLTLAWGGRRRALRREAEGRRSCRRYCSSPLCTLSVGERHMPPV